ncbi:MAG: amidohydrolase family protein [Actinomycetaceae bacterium]|nr:amidohydrolase family protein [Actinomycetaceae bacterium]MDY5854114.1 amidohydrolase family protein [Arcanobacterium sp.]
MAQVFHLTGTLRGTDLSDVWVADGRIHHRAPAVNDAREISELSGFIYPGLVDAHHHPGMSHSAEPVSDAQMLRRLEICRANGVTFIRDAGGQRNAGAVCGTGLPKVIYAGQHIARFKRYTRYLAVEVEPDDFVAEVQRQARAGTGWVKIVADWIDRSLPEPDLAPLWPADILRDGVQAAHDLGAKVMVHTFAAQTVRSVLDAGVDCIEHGTGMDAEQMVEARERGILLDPTVFQVNRFPEFAAAGARFPLYQRRMLEMHERLDERLEQMVQAKSLFVMGTDTAENVAERPLPVELVTAVDHGMPPSVVMKAASYGGRQLLGLSAWEDGAAADFVVYGSDPELDIQQVLHPQAVLIDGILTQ